MVQEVEGREPQLQLLPLRHLEALEERQITVEERRAVNVRPYKRAVGALRWRSEAIRIEVLTGFEVRARVTCQHRDENQISSVASQPSLRTNTDRVSVNDSVPIVCVHVSIGIRLDGST